MRRHRPTAQLVLACVLLFALGPVASAPAAEYRIEPGAGSQVQFLSKAPVETFGGKTRGLLGTITLDPAHLEDSIQVQVDVDMASFDTGIGLRNKHMRENHLHTDKYPKAVFRGGRLANLSAPRLAEGSAVTGTITGEMELHGTKRQLEASFEMRLSEGVLHVTSRFKISLAEYGIPRPQFLVMRLQDAQEVTLVLEARPR